MEISGPQVLLDSWTFHLDAGHGDDSLSHSLYHIPKVNAIAINLTIQSSFY
jgi:hypothetical protein